MVMPESNISKRPSMAISPRSKRGRNSKTAATIASVTNLVSVPSGWPVYDVVEGVGIVNNYRAQFDRFLSKKSFDELLQTLREKKSGLT
jgi:MlaC protein